MPGIEYLYSHDVHKAADSGIQLRTSLDLVPANQYAQLTNAFPLIEGQLQARAGMTAVVATGVTSVVHTIYRLNQNVVSVVGDRLVAVGTQLFHAPLPNGNVLTELTGLSFSGNRLSVISYRFDQDQASWAIIGDTQGMMKYRGGVSTPYYQALGIPVPTVTASASAGGAGNLDSTGGTGYDWLYTWLNRVTGSEGNPSPLTLSAPSTGVKRPTASVNPDPSFGGAGFTNPNNAFANVPGNFASGASASATEARQSCQWGTWAAAGNTPANLSLIVDAEVDVAGTLSTVFATFYYSTDGGKTWSTLFTTSTNAPRQTYMAVIPAGIAFNQLVTRAVVLASGQTGSAVPGRDRQNIVANNIRLRGGDFNNIGDLLDGGGGNRTVTMKIYDINTAIVFQGSASAPLNLVNQSANVCVAAPTATQDPWGQVTHIRLYRRGGSLPDTWRQSGGDFPIASLAQGGCGAGMLQINDNVADSGLGQIIALDNDPPVTSVQATNVPLPNVWGPFDERVLGCGDPSRPEAVYFSKRGNADAWPSSNWVVVSDPGEAIINGCVYNTRTFAFSKERMFELVPNLIGGVTFTPYPTPCSRGLIAAFGLCVGPAVYFVAKDGIYATTGGVQQSLTFDSIQPLFPTGDSPGQVAGGYPPIDFSHPEDISLEYNNGEVWFTYRGVNQPQTSQLVYDIGRQRWRGVQYSNPSMQVVYSERATTSSLLLGGQDGTLYQVGGVSDNGAVMGVNVSTGAFDQGHPLNMKEYGGVIFDIDPGGSTGNPGAQLLVAILINGGVTFVTTLSLTGSGRQRIPVTLSDIFAFNIEFAFSWDAGVALSPVVYQWDILWREEPAQVVHWETRETSHGLEGYQHVRDMYVTLRSTTAVTLTLTMDNTIVQTYTLPSTGGKRSKLYLPMNSNKGKLYHYQFDTATAGIPFQLYEQDIEVRVSPWNQQLGYKVVRPFGGEAITLAQYQLPLNQ